MRVLILSVMNPVPANNGVKMRTWSAMRGVIANGHEVVLVAFAEPRDLTEPHPVLEKACARVIWIPHETKSLSASRDYFGRLKNLFSPTPYGVEASRSSEMAKRVAELLDAKAVDAIVCEQTDLLVNLPARLSVPMLVDFHNLDYLIYARYARLERNPAKRAYALLESRKSRNWERRACEKAAAGIACSTHDRDALAQLSPATKMFVVPNVLDIDQYQPGSREDALKILFQGGMDWYPNRDAVEFFATQILPLVRNQIPEARFVAAGRNPPEDFRRRLSSERSVEFTGTVTDMRAEIADAAVCVVPLRIGSGTRLKILESAAMARAIVSTRLGAEGLGFLNGEEIVLEDDPAAFANAIISLLGTPERRARLGRAARRRVEQDYSFSALSTALRPAMRALTAEVPAAASGAPEAPLDQTPDEAKDGLREKVGQL